MRIVDGFGHKLAAKRLATLRMDSAARAVLEVVAEARLVSETQLLAEGRCDAATALSRQIAMYLMHVELGRHYAVVGRLFGRDRTTVSHACALVEDHREDGAFDVAVDAMESAIRARLTDAEVALARAV